MSGKGILWFQARTRQFIQIIHMTRPMNNKSRHLSATVRERRPLMLMATMLISLVAACRESFGAPCDADYRSACPAIAIEARTLRVVFVPSATEVQVRTALTGVGARIVGGPTQFGEYWLASSSASLDEIKAHLIRSGLTLSVEVDVVGPHGK